MPKDQSKKLFLTPSKSLEDLLESLSIDNTRDNSQPPESSYQRKRPFEESEFGLDAHNSTRQKLEDGAHEKPQKNVRFSDVVTCYKSEVIGQSSYDEVFLQILRKDVKEVSGCAIEDSDSDIEYEYKFFNDDEDVGEGCSILGWKTTCVLSVFCITAFWLGFCSL